MNNSVIHVCYCCGGSTHMYTLAPACGSHRSVSGVPTLFIEAESLAEPGTHKSARLLGWQSSGPSSHFGSPGSVSLVMCHHAYLFYMDARDHTHVLMFTQLALYQGAISPTCDAALRVCVCVFYNI